MSPGYYLKIVCWHLLVQARKHRYHTCKEGLAASKKIPGTVLEHSLKKCYIFNILDVPAEGYDLKNHGHQQLRQRWFQKLESVCEQF